MAGTAPLLVKFRLVFTVPSRGLEACKTAVFAAGAGCYPSGKYTQCCWTVPGTGQFMPGDTAEPYIGTSGQLEVVPEVRVETLCFGEDVARDAVAALVE